MLFYWDKKSGQYKDSSNNRFVRRSVVLKHIERQNKRSKTYLQAQAKKLVNREITLSQFQTLAIEEIKRSHIRMGLLASGGKNGTTKRSYGAMGQRLREEYSYLNNFAGAIAKGELTPKRIIWRAGLYANGSAAAFYKSEQISRIENGAILAKRDLDPNAQHCPDCPALSTNGEWLPIEDVVPPTRQCICRSNCRCQIKYRYSTNASLSDRLVG